MTLLNNLSEIDVEENCIFVISEDSKNKNKKLKILAKKIPQQITKKCSNTIKNGGSVVSVKVDTKFEKAVKEMLQDYSPTLLEII